MGALGGSHQGHGQGWDRDLDWGEGRTDTRGRVTMEVRRLPLHMKDSETGESLGHNFWILGEEEAGDPDSRV